MVSNRIIDKLRCQAVRPERAWNNAGGNPVWKGINHSTRSEFWVANGNIRS